MREYFLDTLDYLQKNNIRINGEFYVDSCIDAAVKIGLRAKVFEIEHYISWGTPNDYQTYKYWQSYFHKSPKHPYSLAKDKTVEPQAIKRLEKEYRPLTQQYT